MLCSLNLELVFLVDSSTKSGDTSSWQLMLQYVNSMIDRYNIGQSATRIGFIRFADSSETNIQLYSVTDRNSVKQIVLSIGYWTGGSNVASALDRARIDVLTSHVVRSNAARVVVIVTDNFQSNSQASSAANALKSSGTTIVGVGINRGRLDANGLRALSTNNQMYTVNDYNQLSSIVTQVVPITCVKPGKSRGC